MLKKILAVLVMLYAAVAMAAVDVNKATEAQLDGVKGIGPGTSKMILDERKKGQFKDWADFIARVKGIAEARAANLSEAGLTVDGKAYRAMSKKDEKKAEKAAKKEEKAAKKDAKADKKADKKDDKPAAAKPAASAPAKPAASAPAKPAASAPAKPAASAPAAKPAASAAKPAASAKK